MTINKATKLLIETDISNINNQTRYGSTPLYLATKYQYTEIVKLLTQWAL